MLKANQLGQITGTKKPTLGGLNKTVSLCEDETTSASYLSWESLAVLKYLCAAIA